MKLTLPGLKAERERRGRTVQDLARASGINHQTLHRIERGHPAMPITAERLASALDVAVEALRRPPPGASPRLFG